MSNTPSQKLDIKYLVRALLKYNASDLHLKVDRPPLYRINGKLIPAKIEELKSDQLEQLLFSILTDKQVVELEKNRQVDLSFSVAELGRFRCQIFFQRGCLSSVIRMIPFNVPNLDDMGIPSIVKELCQRPRGLLLVTGATGSGKSTTLASMIQYLNENQHIHILTMEDPIEFTYRDLKASVTQRELGSDMRTMKEGLHAGLRQDPDVIMIGELRDFEMMQLAMTAAETGHLVMATLHTNDAKSSIDRIIDVFPAESKNQVRIQLASTLVGVISQQLVLRADGSGQVPACEIMVKSPAIESYILKNELSQIPDAIKNSNGYYKMQTMNRALIALVQNGTITVEEAVKSSASPDEIRMALGGVSRDEGYELVGGSPITSKKLA